MCRNTGALKHCCTWACIRQSLSNYTYYIVINDSISFRICGLVQKKLLLGAHDLLYVTSSNNVNMASKGGDLTSKYEHVNLSKIPHGDFLPMFRPFY